MPYLRGAVHGENDLARLGILLEHSQGNRSVGQKYAIARSQIVDQMFVGAGQLIRTPLVDRVHELQTHSQPATQSIRWQNAESNFRPREIRENR